MEATLHLPLGDLHFLACAQAVRRRDCKYKHDRAHGPLAHGRLGCLVFGHVLGPFSCKVPIFEDPFVVGMLSLLSVDPKYEVFCMGMLVLILDKIMFSFCV